MPGQSVKVDNQLANIIERGAQPNTHYVIVCFKASGRHKTYINEQILKIKRH